MQKEIVEKLSRYYVLRKQLEILLAEKTSLEEAKKLIEKQSNRKIYRFMGPFAIEVTYEEAKQYINNRLELLDIEIKKIEKEIESLAKELERIPL